MKRRGWIYIITIIGAPSLLMLCLFFGPGIEGLPRLNTEAGRNILDMRIQRIMLAFFVGAALSCSGAIFQALLRNALADPYILGVSSGAGLGAAIAIMTGVAAAGVYILPAIAFFSAVVTLAVVYTVAGGRGSTPSVYSLILSGVIVSAICSSILMFLVTIFPRDGLHSVIWWMLGNLQPASKGLIITVSAVIAAGFLCAWLLSPEMDALSLGREAAHNVGVKTGFAVTAGLAVASLLAASAVAGAGLIGFVGLVVPHVVRNICGPDHRRLIPLSFIWGGVFLALCDALARTVLKPVEIPVGVITAMCGGPFFLIILRQKKRKTWIE